MYSLPHWLMAHAGHVQTIMEGLFNEAVAFNSDISTWQVSQNDGHNDGHHAPQTDYASCM